MTERFQSMKAHVANAEAETAAAPAGPAAKDKTDEPAADTPADQLTPANRKWLADHGLALKDGSFPIRNADDLAAAKSSVGRASNADEVRAWINQRAKELNLPPLGGD